MNVFKSKSDLWINLIFFASLIACVYAAMVIAQEHTLSAYLWAAILVAIGLILPAWIWAGTKYTVTDGKLEISCGPFRKIIRTAEIT